LDSASSFHLIWQLPRSAVKARLVEVSTVLEVVEGPSVPSLYFWALQVDFVGPPGPGGGAHTGLQWNARYPGNTAVNWGGYSPAADGGGVLKGTLSALPGFADDPNTLSYSWRPGCRYRLRVFRSPQSVGAFTAEVTDLDVGLTQTIRDLFPSSAGRPSFISRWLGRRSENPSAALAAGYLGRPMVWSEVFAPCDARSTTVRWSSFQALTEEGTVVVPESLLVNYQARQAGGCPNTNVETDGEGILQVTNVPRRVPRGALIPIR